LILHFGRCFFSCALIPPTPVASYKTKTKKQRQKRAGELVHHGYI
jgi:hypothetical protein